MYLFSKVKKKLNKIKILNDITQNETGDLTHTRVTNFIFNIVKDNIHSIDSIERDRNQPSFFKNDILKKFILKKIFLN